MAGRQPSRHSGKRQLFFSHADLGTIKGIAGILSSTGEYGGTLDNIVVDGKTDTPDFRVATAGRMVPLHAEFHAIVDGTTGDTYLQPVKAKILNSWLVANGSVVRTTDPNGHRVVLDVVIENGKIEDLLKLAVRTDPPIMTGFVRLKTKFDLPPGEPDFPTPDHIKKAAIRAIEQNYTKYTATGGISLQVTPSPVRSFDLAGPLLILREAGGIVSDYAGGPVDDVSVRLDSRTTLLASLSIKVHAFARQLVSERVA